MAGQVGCPHQLAIIDGGAGLPDLGYCLSQSAVLVGGTDSERLGSVG